MFLLVAEFCNGIKEWIDIEYFDSIENAEKFAHEVLNDPFRNDDLYVLSICDKKGKIIKWVYNRRLDDDYFER